MEKLFAGIDLSVVLVLGIALFLVMFSSLIYLNIRISNLRKRYDQLMTGMEGKDLESMFVARLNDISAAGRDIGALNSRCDRLSQQLSLCVQKVGVVRFNAFDDTGSDLSYAIALLDEKGDGVVLSSIYGRNEARCYAKPVSAGKSSYLLTNEEKQAIESGKK